jgi:pSer/pThr/pTyr-binding forkhead associated (FHA) protein
MSDHLNSMHLELPRREEFRKARARLLDACGDLTRCAINMPGAVESPSDSKTMMQSLANRIPAGAEFALMDKESVYPLKVGLNTIGRLPDNDVVLQDAFVSRRHCAILVHAGDGSELHDVASKNGTFLNGNRLSGPTKLNSGDEIRMCDRQLIFVSKADLHKYPGHQPTMAK